MKKALGYVSDYQLHLCLLFYIREYGQAAAIVTTAILSNICGHHNHIDFCLLIFANFLISMYFAIWCMLWT